MSNAKFCVSCWEVTEKLLNEWMKNELLRILLWMAVANKALNEAEDWGVNDCSTKCTTTSHDRGISYPGWNSILGGHWFESRQFSAFFGLNNQSRRSRWCHNPLKYRTREGSSSERHQNHTIRKVKFLSKNSILTTPPTFSRVFHLKNRTIFSGNQSWIFGQKMKISNSVSAEFPSLPSIHLHYSGK